MWGHSGQCSKNASSITALVGYTDPLHQELKRTPFFSHWHTSPQLLEEHQPFFANGPHSHCFDSDLYKDVRPADITVLSLLSSANYATAPGPVTAWLRWLGPASHRVGTRDVPNLTATLLPRHHCQTVGPFAIGSWQRRVKCITFKLLYIFYVIVIAW